MMMTEKKSEGGTCGTCCSGMGLFLSLLGSAVVLGAIIVGGMYWISTLSCNGGASDEELTKTNGDVAALQGELDALQSELDTIVSKEQEGATVSLDEELSSDAEVLPESSTTSVSKYAFAAMDIEVGDELGDFTVKSIKPYDSGSDLSETNVSVRLTGVATISGRYQYYESTSPLAGQVCITDLDDESAMLLPNFEDRDSVIICFTNNDVAQQLFGPKGSVGSGTFTIDDYTLNVAKDDEEVTDMSTLIKATKESAE